MIQKEQLVKLLLRQGQTLKPQQDSVISASYERDKRELIDELMKLYQKTDGRIDSNKRRGRQLFNQQYPKNCGKGTSKICISNADKEQSQMCYQNEQSIVEQVFLNEYFKQRKGQMSQKRYYNDHMNELIEQRQEDVEDQLEKLYQLAEDPENSGYRMLDKFVLRKKRRGLEDESLIDRLKVGEENQSNQRQFIKSFNESTLAGSKFGKLSPARSFRITERVSRSKSRSSQNGKRKNKNSKSPLKLEISRVSEIEIRPSCNGFMRPRANEKEQTLIQRKHNYSEGRSNIKRQNKNESTLFRMNSSSPANVIPAKSNMSKQKATELVEERQQKKKMTLKERSVKRSECSDRNLLGRKKLELSLDLQQPQVKETQKFDYDQESNIFDRIKDKEIEEKAEEENNFEKITFKDIKDVWDIKDGKKFEKEVKMDSKAFEKSKLKESSKGEKKEQIKIFDKSENSHFYRKEKLDKLREQNEEEEQNSNGKSQEEENEESANVFNILKKKLTFLNGGEAVKKKEEQLQKKKEAQVDNKQKISLKQNKEVQGQESDMSMKAEASDNSGSSFMREKKSIAREGIRNIDVKRMVGETVKIVSVNLSKAESKRMENKLSGSQKQSQQQLNDQLSKARSAKPKQQQLKKDLKARDEIVKYSKNDERKVSKSSSERSQREISLSKLAEEVRGQQIQEDKDSQCHQVEEKSSKKSKNNTEKEVNLSVDFFAASRPISGQSNGDGSHPSTVKKMDSQSLDKSDILKQLNFEQVKDNSLAQNLFQKFGQDERQADYICEQKLQTLKNSGKREEPGSESSSLQASYNTSIVKKPKNISINLKSLKEISLSEDALSFSKLENVKDLPISYVPASSLVYSETKWPKKQSEGELKNVVVQQLLPTAPQKQSPKKGKVKRIQINLDQSSSDSEIAEDSDDNIPRVLDLDEIQDYDSDDEKEESSGLKKRGKQVLAPVIEEDLEQSEFNKNQPKKVSIVQEDKFQEVSEKKEESIRMLEQQFLKDFPLNKLESEVESYKFDIKKTNSKENKAVNIKSTESNLMISEESAISNDRFDGQDQLQREMIGTIKGDIQNLKKKIESSVILDVSNIQEKRETLNNKEGPVKIISIDLSLNKSKNGSIKMNSNSNILKQGSFLIDNNPGDKNATEHKTLEIDFDEINAQSGQQLFRQFKTDLRNLEKKMKAEVVNNF